MRAFQQALSEKDISPPLSALTHYHLGRLHQELENLNDTVTNFNKAVELNINDSDALYHIGLFEHEMGNATKAVELYSKAVMKDANMIEAHVNLGNIYADKEDFENAVYHFKNAVKCKVDLSDKEVKGTLAMAHKNLAFVYLDQLGKLDLALRHLRLSTEYEGNLHLEFTMSEIFLKMEEFALADKKLTILAHKVVPNFTEAVNLDMKYVEKVGIELSARILNNLGITHFNAKYTERKNRTALKCFTWLLQLPSERDRGEIYFHLGCLYKELKNDESAIHYLLKAIDEVKDPKYQELSYLLLGETYKEKSDYQNSCKYFLMAEKLNSYDAPVHDALADCYIKLGDIQKAIQQVEISLSLEKDNPQNLGLLASLMLLDTANLHNNMDKIHGLVKKGLSINPEHPTCNFVKGKILYLDNQDPHIILKYLEKACNNANKSDETTNKNVTPSEDLIKEMMDKEVYSGEHLPEALKLLSQVKLKIGDKEGAIEALKSSLVFTDDVDSIVQLAHLYSETGRIEEGISLLRRVAVTDQDNPTVHFNLANLFIQNDQMTQAVNHYEKALEILSQASLPDNKLLFKILNNLTTTFHFLQEETKFKFVQEKLDRLIQENPQLLNEIMETFSPPAAFENGESEATPPPDAPSAQESSPLNISFNLPPPPEDSELANLNLSYYSVIQNQHKYDLNNIEGIKQFGEELRAAMQEDLRAGRVREATHKEIDEMVKANVTEEEADKVLKMFEEAGYDTSGKVIKKRKPEKTEKRSEILRDEKTEKTDKTEKDEKSDEKTLKDEKDEGVVKEERSLNHGGPKTVKKQNSLKAEKTKKKKNKDNKGNKKE
uniref:Uncharacterized protein n=2 Tax=Arcella intermedia TaxID=1963864 RepID=A0A6B2KXN8_9EUKA